MKELTAYNIADKQMKIIQTAIYNVGESLEHFKLKCSEMYMFEFLGSTEQERYSTAYILELISYTKYKATK